MTLRHLAELGPEWKRLRDAAQRQAQAQREARAQAEASTTLARDQARLTRAGMLHAQRLRRALPATEPSPPGLFARSVGPVHLLRGGGLAELDLPRPPPIARQRALDEQAALAQSMSDEVNLESLLLTDDGLSFRRPGVGPDVLTKLRRGVWALQGQIDLHGCQRDEARELLAGYIHDSHRRGLRCLRVVHGKGHGSPGRQPVLKARVQRWLAQSAAVIAFAQATGPQGGAGALMVLLAAQVGPRA